MGLMQGKGEESKSKRADNPFTNILSIGTVLIIKSIDPNLLCQTALLHPWAMEGGRTFPGWPRRSPHSLEMALLLSPL